ncbi:MAG TPA: glycosyltransferase family 2 protein [Candidatus Binatia bacterium]|nr:glycosyltransferase family 2 protein [Candidatus Binatia bacterium]
MSTLSLTIITATYNAAATLRHSLDSVATQQMGRKGDSPFTKRDCPLGFEHLLIDGGSTDGTLEIARQYPHITRIVSEPDRGIYDAMNKGLRLATGEIIGILNADDFYADGRVLERVAKVFEDPTVEACYGDLVYVQETGMRHEARGNGETQTPITNHHSPDFKILRYWQSGSFTPDKFKWGWMPPHPSFFVRRTVYERFGLFKLDLGSAADYELMLRFLLKHRIKTAYIPEVLVCMRAGGVSNASLNNRLKANQMDRKAWEVNGLKPYPWTLLCKPLRKVPQYFLRP